MCEAVQSYMGEHECVYFAVSGHVCECVHTWDTPIGASVYASLCMCVCVCSSPYHEPRLTRLQRPRL